MERRVQSCAIAIALNLPRTFIVEFRTFTEDLPIDSPDPRAACSEACIMRNRSHVFLVYTRSMCFVGDHTRGGKLKPAERRKRA